MQRTLWLSFGALLVLALASITFAQQAPSSQPQQQPVRRLEGWGNNIDQAIQQAADSRKMVLVFFGSSNIPPARAMRDQVLSNPRLASALQSVIPVQIDVDEQPEIAGKYKINQLPVFVVLDGRGTEIDRFGGYLPPRAFVETLRSAIDPNQSIPVLQSRIKQDNGDLEARWLLARKYARDKNREALDAILQEMTQLDPENAQGFLDNVAFLRMMTSLNPKLPEEGLQKTEDFLQEFPDSEYADQVEMARAQMAYQAGQVDKSLQILEDFPRNYPDSPLTEQVRRDLEAIKAKQRSQ